jgi:hypothetical protein
VISSFGKLSSTQNVILSTGSSNIEFKKFERYYDGGYVFTFYDALSSIHDHKTKNYTNFYLTRTTNLDSIIKYSSDGDLKTNSLMTSLNFGDIYLEQRESDLRVLALSGIYTNYDQYGAYSFTNSENPNTNFFLELKDGNTCNISYFKNYKQYFLTYHNNSLNFYTKKLSLSSIDFDYIYSKSKNAIFLFKNISGVPNFVRKSGNILTLTPVTSSSKLTIYNNPIYLNRPLYKDYNYRNSFNYVKYDSDNIITESNNLQNLTNNFLLHNENDTTDIIILKNQLNQNDIFVSGNTLISSYDLPFFVDGMREYTSIFNDIKSEKDESLSLNYVLYNKSYTIKPGKNEFVTPNDMTPFSQINVNDCKFVDCGSFAYPTPQYADKIYQKDENVSYDDGQTFLCTWLSGSPLGDNGVWVDRYYYPDRISKENALQGNNTFNPTYENLIEIAVRNNLGIQNSINSYEYYDKKSDMVFSPNKTYIYDRISKQNIEELNIFTSDSINPCKNLEDNNSPINYFKTLNESGKFSIVFYFSDNLTDWVLQSKRNNIDAGVRIRKNSNQIELELKLYNPSNGDYYQYSNTSSIKSLKNNFVCFSIDVFKGVGYFFLNSNIVSKFDIPSKQFFSKNVIFGDFVINNVDIFKDQTILKNVRIYDNYIDESLVNIIPILDGESQIDDIHITLPCGMRNSSDNIEYLQSVCENQSFKSNHINIYMKNTDLSEQIKSSLENEIHKNIDKLVPLTTEINNIKFENYK